MNRTTPRRELPPEAAALPEPVLEAARFVPPLDLAALFARRAPIEVEVGFGKGRFLLAEATARPDTDFLGLERSMPYLRLVRHGALERGLRNVRLLAANARDVFHRLIPGGSLAAVYILFPDPWPKRRHHKRRLIDSALAADLASALAPGGALHVVTDNEAYAAAILGALATVPALALAPGSTLALAGRTHYAAKLAPRGATFHARTWLRR